MVVPLILGIAGGSGAGKTTIAQKVVKEIGLERSLILSQDAYYRDRGDLPLEERERANFDHPSAFENRLLTQHLWEIKRGNPIPKLSYDYRTHLRRVSKEFLRPRELVVVEGIMLLEDEELRKVFDLKVWVETSADLRFIRRLKRDMAERGRSLESVVQQYLSTVRPMHLRFVEPSRRYADLVISGEGDVGKEVTIVTEKVKALFEERGKRWIPSLRRR